MDYAGKTVKDPSNIDDSQMKNVLAELDTWCMNYRGFINQVFSEQVTMEEKVTKLFWVVKKVAESQLDVTESYNDLYQFVINYFDSHDFQTMVNNKLDQMAQDGTLESLINDRILGDIKNDMNNQKVLVGKLTGWSLSGKQVDWFGDSLIYGETKGQVQVEKPIPLLFSDMTGCNSINHAVCGATISRNLWKSKIYDQINNADISASDFVIVEGGINDYLLNYPTSPENMLGSFEGGLIDIFNLISSKNPKAKIIMLTMFPNNALFNGSLGHDGLNFIDYNLSIQKICKKMCVRCIDMTYNSINKTIFNSVSTDGTHFTQEGYRLLSVSMMNAINTASNDKPIISGNNLIAGLFPFMDLTGTVANKTDTVLTENTIVLRPSTPKVYSAVAVNIPSFGTYTLHFKMCVYGGVGNVYFGCETYERLGAVKFITGESTGAFYEYNISINPTYFDNRLVFTLDKESTCDYVIITDITLCEGENPCIGDRSLKNSVNVALNNSYFNSQYPLQFKQRDRFIIFNGPVQTTTVVPASTVLVDLSNYNFAKGRYCPYSAVIFATGLDGSVYPLLFDLSSYTIKNLKQIPASTNLGITSVIDIS